ncbi:Transcription initiation factor TFIID subunit 9B [Entophlyctis luteolus]|nr:Transcription initiation factor TFIID subunit 9B [Entophlyctis luteolus]
MELPRNAKLVSLLMQAMDVTDYHPAVLPQALEFMHRKYPLVTGTRYVLDVVGDAQLFAEHAGRSELAVDDVRLAIEGKLSHSFTPLPSNEVLAGLADVKNSAPLPLFSEKLGLRLPPERHTLTGVNFHILPKKPPQFEGHSAAGSQRVGQPTQLSMVENQPQMPPVAAPVFAQGSNIANPALGMPQQSLGMPAPSFIFGVQNNGPSQMDEDDYDD